MSKASPHKTTNCIITDILDGYLCIPIYDMTNTSSISTHSVYVLPLTGYAARVA